MLLIRVQLQYVTANDLLLKSLDKLLALTFSAVA